MARPTKFTPETIKRLTDAIRMGATYSLACKYAGISYEIFNQWRNGSGYPQGTTAEEKMQFVDAIQKAEGDAAVGWLTKIEKAANEGHWQAAAWKMERRYPNEYGRTVQQIEGSDGGPLVVSVIRDHPPKDDR
jgi:transposase